MSTQNEKQAAEKLLAGFADVLNNANADAIASFYTQDGVFMPDGFKKLTATDLGMAGNQYLKKSGFQISYDIESVTFDREFAFVETIAKIKVRSDSDDKTFSQSSRDFFVLRKEEAQWKIYRYIFNHVRAN
jgi:ketosteroid isomerase-like protein